MRSSKISKTYEFIYDYILNDLISQITSNYKYCFRANNMPYIIGEKFEEYREYIKSNMKGKETTKLDRHKIASCLCGAIIDTKPLMEYNNIIFKKNINEILGLNAGLNIIKFYMLYTYVNPLQLPPNVQKEICSDMLKKYNMRFPDYDENICDTQKYEYNLINNLTLTHKQCDITKHDCFCYDVWAYSRIFYHLELYNKPHCKVFFQNYIKTL